MALFSGENLPYETWYGNSFSSVFAYRPASKNLVSRIFFGNLPIGRVSYARGLHNTKVLTFSPCRKLFG